MLLGDGESSQVLQKPQSFKQGSKNRRIEAPKKEKEAQNLMQFGNALTLEK